MVLPTLPLVAQIASIRRMVDHDHAPCEAADFRFLRFAARKITHSEPVWDIELSSA